MNALRRIIVILADPAGEWVVIEKEPGDAAYLLSHYVAPLALIPAVFGLIGACAVGTVVPGAGLVRVPLSAGLVGAVFGYIMSCATVVCLGALIRLLAPAFGGQRDFNAAFKLAAYSYTPIWLTGIFLLAPGLRFLELIGFYGAYILWTGASPLTRVLVQKLPGFAAILVVCACVLIFIIGALQHTLFGGTAQ
jgi:Yip1 domain